MKDQCSALPPTLSKTTKESGRSRIGKTLSQGEVAEGMGLTSNLLHLKSLFLKGIGATLGRQSSMLFFGFFFLARTFFCRINPSANPLSDLNNLTSQEAARTRRSDLVTHLG